MKIHSIIRELEDIGFRPGLRMEYVDGRFRNSEEEASDVPPPLVYVLVDRHGESVRTGRSLRQTISQREAGTPKGLNRESTLGQNNKPVIKDLRKEIRRRGPLVSYVKHMKNDDSAKAAEKRLFDLYRGRLDKRRG